MPSIKEVHMPAERSTIVPESVPDNYPNNKPRDVFSSPPELISHESPIREFRLPPEVKDSLDEHQRRLLLRLERVTRRWADLFELRVSKDPRFPFYPPGVDKSEIFEEDRLHPELQLLSEYTIVKLTDDGDLIAIPMHQFYAKTIEEKGIIPLLKEAAADSGRGRNRDNKFQAYLRVLAESLKTGNFKASTKIWLEREAGDEPVVDIILGFNDTYQDKFLGIKFSPWASVGVLDRQLTRDSQWYINAYRPEYERETGQESPRVNIRADHTRLQSGLAVQYEWNANCLPCQRDWRQELGSKFVFFVPRFENKLPRRIESFREFIKRDKIQGITDSFVKLAAFRKLVAHEFNHSQLPGENHQQRLRQHTSWLKELYCDLLALTCYRGIKGISPRETEMAMAMTLADGYLDFEDRRKRADYHIASTILTSFLLQRGSVRIENGVFTWDDSQNVFNDIKQLLLDVRNLLEEGRFRDVQRLHWRLFRPDIYRVLLAQGTFSRNDQK